MPWASLHGIHLYKYEDRGVPIHYRRLSRAMACFKSRQLSEDHLLSSSRLYVRVARLIRLRSQSKRRYLSFYELRIYHLHRTPALGQT